MIRRRTEYSGLPNPHEVENVKRAGLPDINENNTDDTKRKKQIIVSVFLGVLVLIFLFFPEKPNFEKLIFTQTADASTNSFVLYFDCDEGKVNGMSIRDKKIYHLSGKISRMGDFKLEEIDTSGASKYGDYIGKFDSDDNRIECSWIPPNPKKVKPQELNFSVENEKSIDDFLPKKTEVPSVAKSRKKEKKHGFLENIFGN